MPARPILAGLLEFDGLAYLAPFLGAGGDWLHLVSQDLVPPVSWMGGKRRLAHRIMELLGLTPGQRLLFVLGDASWWGWVWPLCLDEVTGPQVCAWLRRWQGEDPRALWFRLRDAGPPADLVERAAGLLWLQARAASGVPVWWEGDEVVSMDGHGRGPYRAWQATAQPKLVQECGWKSETCSTRRPGRAKQSHAQDPDRTREDRRLVQWASTKVDEAGQTRATEPRLLASDGRGVGRPPGHRGDKAAAKKQACGKGFNAEGAGGMVNPATIADRLEQTRARLVMATRSTSPRRADMGRNDGHREKHGWRAFEPGDVAARIDSIRTSSPQVVIAHCDALDLVRAAAPVLGRRARIYLDPPYQHATGYPVTCSRDHVLAIAEESARHGGRVVLSEAVGLAAELGPGWRQVQLRRGPKPEWVTLYNCSAQAEHGRLFHAGGAA